VNDKTSQNERRAYEGALARRDLWNAKSRSFAARHEAGRAEEAALGEQAREHAKQGRDVCPRKLSARFVGIEQLEEHHGGDAHHDADHGALHVFEFV
jgi:hypothetical protein